MNRENREYNITFGILSCIGILCVVMGHLGCPYMLNSLFPYYSFHIALFFFISGYFYDEAAEQNVIAYVWKKARKLLLSFYLAVFVMLLIQTALKRFGYSIGLSFSIKNWLLYPWYNSQYPGFSAPCWFLIALFMVCIANVALRKIVGFLPASKHLREVLISLAYLAIMVAVVSYSGKNPVYGCWKVLLRSCFFLFWYQLGHLYKLYFEEKDNCSSVLYFGLVIAIRIVLSLVFGDCGYLAYDCGFLVLWPVTLLVTLTGILFWLRVAKLLTPIVHENGLVIRIGKHTREIMTWHLLALFVFQSIEAAMSRRTEFFAAFNMEQYMSDPYYLFIIDKNTGLVKTALCVGLILLFCRVKEKITKKPKVYYR